MRALLRMLLALAALPFCWALARVLLDAVWTAAGRGGGVFGAETIAFVAGMAAFLAVWVCLPHPMKTYVLAHELTHALWGLFFFAKPSKLRVAASGGSVRLTKSNLLITLAPYFFPFYSFIVILLALATWCFVRPLPCLPAWMFAIAFTWAFHILFTLDTLATRQPDITLYGRIFSWTFIYVANVAVVLIWLAATTNLAFAELWDIICSRTASAYSGVSGAALYVAHWLANVAH